MKNYLALLLLIPTLSCSQQTEKKKNIVDYQGKELSEAEVRAFMKAEMDRFESLNTKIEVQVTKVNDIKSIPEWIDKGQSFQFRDLDVYNVQNKLIEPYLTGQLSAKDFLSIVDTLNDQVKGAIPHYFANQFIPQLKTDRVVLDKILKVDQVLQKGSYGLLIRAAQKIDGSMKEVEDSINSNTFYVGEYYAHRGAYLARYAAFGNHDATLSLLAKAVLRMPVNGSINDYQGDYLNAFEYPMLYGTQDIRNRTRKLLIEYLTKASFDAFDQVKSVFSGEVADDLKQLIKVKRRQIEVLNDPDKKRKAEDQFKGYYLNICARHYGKDALPLLNSLLFEGNDAYYAFPALREMARYGKLSESDKAAILTMLQKANDAKPGPYLNECVSIVKYLYPEKKLADVAPRFKDENDALPQFWNRKRYDAKDIDQHLLFLKGIGLVVDDFSVEERYTFLKQFEPYNSEWMIYGLLDVVGVMVQYDCETGMWPNPYDELMQHYLSVCAEDLGGYYPVYFYEQISEEETKYTAILTNGKDGYVTNPRDAGDWYDPIAVEALFNQALKEKGSDKRFMQVLTGDQTVASVYCTPGQLKLIADKFGIEIMEVEQ